MTVTQKKEALSNALAHYNFDKKYSVDIADKRIGHKFAIVTKTETSLNVHTNYMTYDEFNAYLYGYYAATLNNFSTKL